MGSNGDDRLFGNAGSDYVGGADGDDRLWGAEGSDTVNGGSGNDIIFIDRGDNQFDGSTGRDILAFNDVYTYGSNVAGFLIWSNEVKEFTVGFNVDLETGETRSQPVFGSNQYSDVWGTSTFRSFEEIDMTNQNDVVRDNDEAHEIRGRGGNDVLEGRGGADFLRGGPGTDTASYASSSSGVTVNLLSNLGFNGDAAGDTFELIENLIGSSERDYLIGDNAANRIEAGGGNDQLAGNGGADTLVGGASYDEFIYHALTDSSTSARDVILGFESSNDWIDLHEIDARSGTRDNDAFSFVGTRGFSHLAGELRYSAERDASGVSFNRVEGDVNGDAIADFAISVYSGGQPLGAYDFTL